MEYNQCNKKAKEAWGKYLVDLSADIMKKLIYFLTSGALTGLAYSIFHLYKNGGNIDQLVPMIQEIWSHPIVGLAILFTVVIVVILAISLQRTGIRYIHESDTSSEVTPQEADPLKAAK